MQDSTLLMLALAVSCLGILALAVIASFSSDQFDNPLVKEDGEKISVKGTVLSASFDSMKTRILVQIPVEVVVFHELNLSKDQQISVQGAIQEYQGRKSILGSSVVVGNK